MLQVRPFANKPAFTVRVNSVRNRMAGAALRLYDQQSDQSEKLQDQPGRLSADGRHGHSDGKPTLSDFKDEGLIAKKGNMITFSGEKRLAKLKAAQSIIYYWHGKTIGLLIPCNHNSIALL